jgi:hypothetical protein
VRKCACERIAQLRRQHRFDFHQRRLCTGGQFLAGKSADKARANHQRFEFVGGKHQGRDVRTFAQDVTDARFAFDRYA